MKAFLVEVNGMTQYAVIGCNGEVLSRKYADKEKNASSLEGNEILRFYDTAAECFAYAQGCVDTDMFDSVVIGDDLEYHEHVFGKITDR